MGPSKPPRGTLQRFPKVSARQGENDSLRDPAGVTRWMTHPRPSEREVLSAPSLRELSRQLADGTEGVPRRIVLSPPGQDDMRSVRDSSPFRFRAGAARNHLPPEGEARAGGPSPSSAPVSRRAMPGAEGRLPPCGCRKMYRTLQRRSDAIRGSRPTRKRGDAPIPSQSRRRADVTAPPKGGAKS